MRLRAASRLRSLPALAALVVLGAATQTVSSFGQATAAASNGPSLSRVDLYAGYSYLYPFTSDIGSHPYQAIPYGGTGSLALYFNRTFGIQAEGMYAPDSSGNINCATTAQAGPIVRHQFGRVVPFLHVLGGGAEVGGPISQQCNVWGWVLTGGGGVDVILPAFHNHVALRPIQADFLYSDINNGPVLAGGTIGGIGQIYAARVSAGIVFRFGDIQSVAKVAPTFTCTADPGDPFPGDPVTLTASTMNVNPKRQPKYLWTSSGGKIAGDGASAAIDTADMQPGTYEVTGKLVEGEKQKLIASCTTSFTVRAYEPPTLTCSADKAAINSGDPVTITAAGRSPQNRPLTYSYTTSAGLIVGNGTTAGLSTAGVAPGNITATCKVDDDKGQSATATASIVVATPPPPTPAAAAAVPQTQALCSITFDRDKKRPDRVDNEAKGCLDDVALSLNRESSDKLLIVGSHADKETNRDSAERAMNAADYLTKEKGIDPARLDLRIGPDNSRSVAMMLVPPGAVIDDGTATSFDTSSVKRRGQAYGVPKAAGAPTKPPVHRRKKRPAAAPVAAPPPA